VEKCSIQTTGTRYILRMDFSLFGAFAKLRKATISFVLSVCPFVRTEQLVSNWTYFNELMSEYFSKISRENSSLAKI